ncbi:hypothetical protein MMC20_004507 [Loxospora ochrophaea]|nr:hypothetical protein [Loxospora ochrophaea]
MSDSTGDIFQYAPRHQCQSDGRPPAYEVHAQDIPYPSVEETVQREEPSRLPNAPLTEPCPRSTAWFPERLFHPLSLTMDNDLIYPTMPPSTALFHVPRNLQWMGERVYLHRSVPERTQRDGTTTPPTSQELYDIICTPLKEWPIELHRKRASCYGRGVAVMTRRNLRHPVYEVWFKKELTLRCIKHSWTDAYGKILAIEEEQVQTGREDQNKERRVMVIQAGVDIKMMNLLVACWTTKVWRASQRLVRTSYESASLARWKEAFKTGSKLELF